MRRFIALSFLLLVLVPSCFYPSFGRSDEPRPPPSCVDVGSSLAAFQPQRGTRLFSEKEKAYWRGELIDAVDKTCTADQWAASILACARASTEMAELDTCLQPLSAEQRAHYDAALAEIDRQVREYAASL